MDAGELELAEPLRTAEDSERVVSAETPNPGGIITPSSPRARTGLGEVQKSSVAGSDP